MIVAQDGEKIALLTQQVRNWPFRTSSAWYKQITDKPTHILNKSLSCINLKFCTNQSAICKQGVDISIFAKCIIISYMVRLTFSCCSRKYFFVKSKI